MGEVRATGANQVWALCGRILLGVMSGRLLWGKRKKKEVTPGELGQWWSQAASSSQKGSQLYTLKLDVCHPDRKDLGWAVFFSRVRTKETPQRAIGSWGNKSF